MRYLLLILILPLLFSQHAVSQCCSPGNPIGGTSALGVNDLNSWKLFLNYRYGYSGQYYEGDQPSETQFIQDGNFNHLGLIAAYGLSSRLTIEAELGYFINKTQRYIDGVIPAQQSGSGLTDVHLSARLNLFRNTMEEWEITTGLGAKIPIGTNEQKDTRGAFLPRDLQPTTGAYDLVHSMFFYKGFLNKKIRTFLLTRIEYRGKSLDEYRYGNLYAASLFGSFSPSTQWIFIGQIRSEFRGQDTRPESGFGIPDGKGREKIIPTGSRKFFLTPQISYSVSSALQVSILAEVPVYQHYNDKQLSTTAAIMLSLGYTISKPKKLFFPSDS